MLFTSFLPPEVYFYLPSVCWLPRQIVGIYMNIHYKVDRVYTWGFNASQNTPLHIICILFLKHIDKACRTGTDTLLYRGNEALQDCHLSSTLWNCSWLCRLGADTPWWPQQCLLILSLGVDYFSAVFWCWGCHINTHWVGALAPRPSPQLLGAERRKFTVWYVLSYMFPSGHTMKIW